MSNAQYDWLLNKLQELEYGTSRRQFYSKFTTGQSRKVFKNISADFSFAFSFKFAMTSCKGETSDQSKEEVNYEEAMNQALSEIFQNLKEIQQDTKRQREKLYLERRRGSAPATMVRKTSTTIQQPKNELSRSTSNIWVLQCAEEDGA